MNSNYGGILVDSGGGAASSATAYTHPTAAKWHRFVFTFDNAVGSVNTMYVDGQPTSVTGTATTRSSTSTFISSTLFFFSKDATQRFGNGNIQDFTIYNGILSDAEIAADYDNPYQIFKAPSRRLFFPSTAVAAPVVVTTRPSRRF